MCEDGVHRHERAFGEVLTGAVTAGLFLVLIGIIVVINLNSWPAIKSFGDDFTNVTVPNTSIQWPAPATPAAHTATYSMAFEFALGVAVLEVLVLAMQFGLGLRLRRKAEAVGAVIFWFGAAYLLNGLAGMSSALAVSEQETMWFQFWAAIIVFIGVSLIARAAFLFAATWLRRRAKAR